MLFDGVPLLDRPDEALGRTHLELDRGDEVELVERQTVWARVRTPTDVNGWVLTMTLGGIGASSTEDVGPAVRPAPEPLPPADEPPSLEALLAAISAERRAREEAATPDNTPSRRRTAKGIGRATPADGQRKVTAKQPARNAAASEAAGKAGAGSPPDPVSKPRSRRASSPRSADAQT